MEPPEARVVADAAIAHAAIAQAAITDRVITDVRRSAIAHAAIVDIVADRDRAAAIARVVIAQSVIAEAVVHWSNTGQILVKYWSNKPRGGRATGRRGSGCRAT